MTLALLRTQRVNLTLIAVAVSLLVTVFLTSTSITTGEQTARESNLLVRFDKAALARITLERGASRAVLERDVSKDAGDMSWRLVEPFAEDPDPETVQNLVGSLELATVVRRVPAADVDRAAFGLDAPRVAIALEMGRVSYRVVLGKDAPAPAGGAYVELTGDGITGEGVVVVRRDLVEQIDVGLDELRGHQLVPYLATTMRALVLEGQGGTRKLRLDAGRWRFDGMQQDRQVDREAFDRVTTQLTRIKAERFLEFAPAQAAQQDAQTVTVTTVPDGEQRPRAVLRVGGACPGDPSSVVAVRTEPTPVAACVSRGVMPALSMPPDQLVARTLFSMRMDEVESVVANFEQRKLELVRQGSAFKLRAPKQMEVGLDVGNGRLSAILAVRGKLVSPDAAAGLVPDTAPGTLALTTSTGLTLEGRTETIRVTAADPEGRVYAKREFDGAVVELDRESARVLMPDATLLRKRQVLDLKTRDVRHVSVAWGSARQTIRRSQAGGVTLEEPEGFAIDAGQATAIIDVLASLTADRWVADADDGSFGLGDPAVRATLQVTDPEAGTREHVLLIGRPAPGGAFARLDEDPAVFVMPRTAVETLRTWALDRALFVGRAGEMQQIVLESGPSRVELARSGDEFVQQAGEPRLSPARIQLVLDALAAMRAESAVHLGPARPEEGISEPLLTVTIVRDPVGQLPSSWTIGAGDSWRGTSVYYARAKGSDATYVIARSTVRPLLDCF